MTFNWSSLASKNLQISSDEYSHLTSLLLSSIRRQGTLCFPPSLTNSSLIAKSVLASFNSIWIDRRVMCLRTFMQKGQALNWYRDSPDTAASTLSWSLRLLITGLGLVRKSNKSNIRPTINLINFILHPIHNCEDASQVDVGYDQALAWFNYCSSHNNNNKWSFSHSFENRFCRQGNFSTCSIPG